MSNRKLMCNFIVFFASIVMGIGCAENAIEQTAKAPPDPVVRAPNPNTPYAGARVPSDKSLTLDEYIEAGIPAHDRPWVGVDLAAAASVLTSIAGNDAGKLPRHHSERSGVMFGRITANENLDFYRNQSLPLAQRIPDSLTYMQSTSTISKLYLDSTNKGMSGTGELIELTGAQLRLLVVVLHMFEEFLPTLDKNDPTYPIRMKGLQQMKEAIALSVAGTLQTLTERPPYQVQELKRLLGYMQDTFADILPYLPDGSRRETMVRLRSFMTNPKMADLNPELADLVDHVQNVLDQRKIP